MQTKPARPDAAADFSLSCVVPVFNEAPGIARFLEHLHHCVMHIAQHVELVLVNDGSTDDSAAEILRCADGLPVHYLELSRNFGKEHAIQAGLDVAAGDCVVILDGDFQHPAELIAGMVQRWRAGIDMVYAVRSDRAGERRLKQLGSSVLYRLLALQSSVRIPANAGDFRLLDRKVVLALRALPERTRFMKGLYAWCGFKSEAIEFTPAPRRAGQSKYGALQLTNLAVTGITSFSTTPLRFVSLAGLTIAVGATLCGSWIVFEKLFMKQPIAGFATLAASILFLSGVQLLALGIVGEYVGRIFEEVKQRPLYVLTRTLNRSVVADSIRERKRA
jgi:polyisoprenyl-phosphate glycosyltransferase